MQRALHAALDCSPRHHRLTPAAPESARAEPGASLLFTLLTATVLVPTPAVRNLIREGRTHQIPSMMMMGAKHGMQTMDSALADRVRARTITLEKAKERCSDVDALLRLLKGSPARSQPRIGVAS